MNTLFHLAFPIHDFDLAKHFYLELLGCNLGRESEHALIIQLGNHQIVAHKINEPLPIQQGIYPRHFGLIFLEKTEFEAFVERLIDKQVQFEIPLKTRFPNSKIEHQSFFLKDPSNNLLEFKYYTYPSAIFGEQEFKRIGES
ncbi:VOC family protein [Legionella micdadei]|uniref:Glyoxalase/Bleomycin resistance family protein n=1 Tax=Legionella micdadei TaxID=451 RepID=A0A098GEA9_LEGMI|nr:VOC family protein [Legionella micdadei]ARG98495.1 glyoxalase [Legionella micdadei]ARH01238.1 glyoxalase [Legionella micdadei]KTD30295.1 Glyoxalase/Bleomycin resistance family protein [Legionella micdadei]NSL18431.1 VOC family protein [Legionella micdadei]CEG59816.1 Glyoxalase/Bleomycin resistance family protein [Legionella micdadei]